MFALLTAMAVLLPRVMNNFGGEDPVKGTPWYHQVMTLLAARKSGWVVGTDDPDTPGHDEDGRSAASSLSSHADLVDSYLYNPLFAAAGGLGRFKAALFAQAELVKVHFDDLTSAQQIEIMWRRYLGGQVAGLLWAADRDDVVAARHIVGVGMHALQDFYSHSNWVDHPNRRTRTWFDVPAEERAGLHLYTGTYEQEDHFGFKHHGMIAFDCSLLREVVGEDVMNVLCDGFSPLSDSSLCRRWRECEMDSVPAHPDPVGGVNVPDDVVWLEPPGIALDSVWLSKVNVVNREVPELGTADPHVLGTKLFGMARDLAETASQQWLTELHQIMTTAGHANFWHRVRTEPRTGDSSGPGPFEDIPTYKEDLDQFEHPNKLPSTFLSAGAYPPHPTGSDEGWFVRLELHTSQAGGAGTNSDIDAVIGGKTFRLDHGNDQNQLLQHDDFEAGDQTWYLVGPFDERPGQITLVNHGTDLGDIVEAAWEDFKSLVNSVLSAIGDFLLSLIGGHADYVGEDKRTWSWPELDAIAGTPGVEFEMRCDGGDEGDYRVRGHLRTERQPSGELRAFVRLTQLHCIEESDVDGGSNSDEPFILMLVNSPAAGQIQRFRTSPFEDVDEDETFGIDMEPIVVDVPRHGGLIVPIQIWESDQEGTSGRDRLLRGFASEYGEKTEPGRSELLDAIFEALGPDWRLATMDAFAFRRGAVTKTAHLARFRPIDRWIEAGSSLTIPFGKVPNRIVQVPALEPAVTSTKIGDSSVFGVTVSDGVLYATANPPFVEGQPLQPGRLHALGSHLEPGATVTAGINTRGVAVDRGRNRLYVVNANQGVAMHDATTLQFISKIDLGQAIVDIAVDPAAGLVYASQWTVANGGKVFVLRADDLTKLETVTDADGFFGPVGIALDAEARRLYVARDFRSGGPGAPTVTALSVILRQPDGTHVIERTVQLGDPAVQPGDVAVDPAAGLVYVTGLGGTNVAPRLMVLDRTTHALLGHVLIPGPARAVAARPGTGLAYVVGEGGLTVVDGQARTRDATVPLGTQPVSVAVDPATGVAYVGDHLDGTVHRVEPVDGIG